MSQKRALAAVLLAAALFSLFGCAKSGAAYRFEDVYAVYMDESMSLKKFNILTGELTPLCPDPICDHSYESGCPFTAASMLRKDGSQLFFVSDGGVYFDEQKGDYVLPQSIIRYDFDTGEVKSLCTVNGTKYEGLQGCLIHSGKYVYFSVRAADPDREAFELWRVSDGGGKPEKLGIATSATASGIYDGYAYYSDISGIYRISLKEKQLEYVLKTEDGTILSIYYFDKSGGAYCVERSQNGSAIIYEKVGEPQRRLVEGISIRYMQISQDKLCYSEDNDLYIISITDGAKKKLYSEGGGESLKKLLSCGWGFVAIYYDDNTGESTFIPLLLENPDETA